MSSTAGEVKEHFLDALELEGAERARYLTELRGRSPEVAERVGALLAAHEGRAATALESLGGTVQGLLHGGVGEPGALVGDYELLEEIASGASGVVWRARQRSLGRIVALKVLRAGRLAGQREVARFHAEAEVVARFDHPDIVPVYEVGEHEGRHFFSMRYFAGGSLADRVGPDRPWDPRAAAEMVRTIARAVHHAHQRGLLHRDLKPSNVLLDEFGAPAVADFGVAARIDEAGVAAVTATLAGTPAYMAPEQTGAGGAEHGELTVATDVWALGCVLYELLAGRPPFGGDSLSAILAKVRDEPPLPVRALAPDTPHDLETIALHCLEKQPGRRYASANTLAIDLGRWLEHEPILARRTGPFERLALAWRRNPVVASLGVLVGLLLVVLAVVASWASVQLEGRLRDSYLGEARATRLSGGHGRRARALELLAKAADIRPGPDLRDEAIACLATTDLAPITTLPFEIGELGPACVDADLQRLAYCHAGGEIVVAALPGGEVLRRIRTGGRCDGVRLSGDGRLLAVRQYETEASGRRYELRVLSVDTGEELLRVPRGWAANALAFDPTGRRLAVGDADGRLQVWDLATGEQLLELDRGTYVGALLFDADGRTLVVGAGDDEAAMLSFLALPSGDVLHELALPRRVYTLAWTDAGRALIAGCADYAAYVVALEAEEPRLALLGHRAEVVDCVTPPTTSLAATSSWDRTLRLWDLDTGEELARLSAQALGFSRDGTRLAYRRLASIEIAEVVHGRILRSYHGHNGKSPAAVVFSRDGGRLVSYGADGAILWDLESGQALGRLTDEKAAGVEFAPDGATLFLSGAGGLERRSLSAPFAPGEVLLPGDQDQCDLALDGSLLAVRDDRTLQLLDPAAPDEVRRFPGYPGFEYIALGGHGTYVAGMTWHGPGLTVWRAADGAVLGRLHEDRDAIGAVISPDETRLVLSDGIVYEVYSLPALDRLHVIARDVGMRESPATLAFSEDGTQLALGLTEDTVGLYDARTLELVARLEARGATLDGRAAFSPDGSRLAIASPSNVINVWDLGALWAELRAAGIE